MAIVTSGMYLGFSGTVGDTTFWVMNGITYAKRKNKKRSVPATKNQKRNENDMALVSSHLRTFNEFAKVSFRDEARKRGLNAYNTMKQHQDNKKLLKGEWPDRRIDYSELVLSKGSLPLPDSMKMQRTEKGASFTWSTEVITKTTRHNDQVMMVAYFPKEHEIVYIPAGAQRYVGADTLTLHGVQKGQTAEVYLSFITANGEDIADSRYMGQLDW